MDFKEQLNKIKVMLAVADAPAAPAAPAADGSNPDVSGLTDYILEDGTKISVDKLEVGGAVTMNGTPAPDGEHKLQDGTIVETKDGKIVEISAPGEPSDDQSVNSDMNSKFEAIEGKFTSYEEKFAAYESRFAAAEQTIGKQQEAIGQLLSIVEKLAAAPVAEPAQPTANQFTNEKALAKEDRFNQVVAALKEIKK